MQITIVEAEIKTAIRNYILGQITVNESMKIDIDLRATRGETGYQAIIDISPEDPKPGKGSPKPASQTAPKAAAVEAKAPEAAPKGMSEEMPATRPEEAPVEKPAEVEPELVEAVAVAEEPKPAKVNKLFAAAKAKPAEDTEAKDAAEPAATAAEGSASDEPAKSDKVLPFKKTKTEDQAEQAAVALEGEAQPARSIFSSLRKPVNSATA